jgi:hypothetical protein
MMTHEEMLIEMYGLEYVDYLEELDKERKQAIKNECEHGRHVWEHLYSGWTKCARCHEDLNK